MLTITTITRRDAAYLCEIGLDELDSLRSYGALPRSRMRHGAFEVCVADLVDLGLLDVDGVDSAVPMLDCHMRLDLNRRRKNDTWRGRCYRD